MVAKEIEIGIGGTQHKKSKAKSSPTLNFQATST